MYTLNLHNNIISKSKNIHLLTKAINEEGKKGDCQYSTYLAWTANFKPADASGSTRFPNEAAFLALAFPWTARE